MRFALPTLLSSLLSGSIALAAPAATPATPPVIGCPSLANLRILLRQAGNDPAKAALLLSDDRADHLGCSILGREAVTALADHAALNGNAYDCVTIRTTSVCQWTVAGSVTPAEQARPGRRAQPDTGKAAPGKSVPDKGGQEKTPR
ncbi:hypothetical protein ASF28_14575 [Methylobacterium sp. Leaf99]|uniref:hypothetical protein n=1 Tax=Methylobacterium sp. Leaf99 TaxID=1736251 RepID=UPI0006F78308|nr:hypothetical protein [Methylobacterium sp. Leaf99]KQP07220.1 hypothetical protein ASF28_14575 [Methylobacterium sp. Leaf99]